MTSEQDKINDEKNLPRDINREEVNFKPSAKKWKSTEKSEAKESGKGRDAIKVPADEQFGKKDSQIDAGTIKMQEENKKKLDNTDS